jgi:hypothetical protein
MMLGCGSSRVGHCGYFADRSGALPAVFEIYWNSPECWTEQRRQEGGSA